MSDTIYAQSTPALKSAIAVFRLSGPAVQTVIKAILDKGLAPRKLDLVKVRNPDTAEIIDVCLAVFFPGPSSFTGEDVLELHTHGGLATCREILNLFSEIKGLRLAEPGEFTRRAFENGKIDLSSVEALSDLINADCQYQRRLAMHKMLGGFFDFFESWRRNLLEIRALIEASLDFSDEGDLSGDLGKEAVSRLEVLIQEVSATILKSEQYLSANDGYQVLVAGPPNAGKSSLVNYLAKRRVAIVSDVAGTTRDLIEVRLEIGDYPVILIDSAGFRASENEIEAIGIELARARAQSVDLVLWLGDSSSVGQELGALGAEIFCIAAKCDVVAKSDARLNISIITGDGIDELLETILSKAKIKLGEFEGGGVLFARQLQSARTFEKCLFSAISKLKSGLIEIAALDLENGSKSLADIVNETSHSDLLDSIFSRFCLGK